MFKAFDDFHDSVCRPENLAILRYCYENYEYNYCINAFMKKFSAVQEETNILQESMEEEIDETVSSLDEKDDEESEKQKEEDWISYPCPPSNESNSPLIHYLMSLCSYRIMNAMIIAMIPLIRLKYPFLMNLMLALLAKMPI